MNDIPDEIKAEYKLHNKDIDGHVYVEVRKTIYGLPQSGLLSNELLEKRLGAHGIYQSKLVPGLWKHLTRSIQFTLVVDDFGVKYQSKQDVAHLMRALKENYRIKDDWTGGKYIGITLDWDYVRRQVHLSMPRYNKAALKQFGHKKPFNKTRFSTCLRSHHVRRQAAICTRRRLIAPSRQKGITIDPTNLRKIPIRLPRNRRNRTCTTQLNRITTIRTD